MNTDYTAADFNLGNLLKETQQRAEAFNIEERLRQVTIEKHILEVEVERLKKIAQ